MKKRMISALLALWLLLTAAVPAFSAPSVSDSLTSYSMVPKGEPGAFGYQDYAFVDINGCEEAVKKHSGMKRAAALPSAFDSRSLGVVPPVRNQGNSGNCWCFAALGALEIDAALNHGAVNPDFSEAHLSWFTNKNAVSDPDDRTYGDNKSFTDSPYNTAGNAEFATYTLLKGIGPAAESDYPFYPYDLDAMGNYDEADRYDHSMGYMLTSSVFFDDNDTAGIKDWIMNHGAVQVGMNFDYDYFNTRTTAYYMNVESVVNHAVMIIGWDDSYPASNFRTGKQPDADGAWLCRNSWGNYYDEDGCFWLSYEDKAACSFAGHEISDRNEYDRVYTYNGFGYDTYYSSTGTFKGANVYKADEAALMKAVGVFCRGYDCSITVQVYKNLPANYKTPAAGTLACSFTATRANPGYYVIDLPQTLTLAEGEIYSVTAKITDSEGTAYLFVERDEPTLGFDYSSNQKESYYFLNNTWSDTVSLGVCNTCINAITACPHQYTVTDEIPAGCETPGERTYTCSLCHQSYTETVPALGHHYETETVAPTCEAEGCTRHFCTRCDAWYREDITEPTGHSWSAGYIADVYPTCQHEGRQSVHCLHCDAVKKSAVLPKTAHRAGDWQFVGSGSNAALVKKCVFCGEEMERKAAFLHLPKVQADMGLFDKLNLKTELSGTEGKVVYTSSNPSVAMVNSRGRVIALRDGQAVITAAVEGTVLYDTCTVNVSLTAGEKLLRLFMLPVIGILKILY